MFLPVTLDEAAAWLGSNGVNGVTSQELLRLGAYGYLRICLPLSCRAFSPRKEIENDKKKIGAGIHDYDLKKALDEAYVDLLGIYALPPKTLFELEAKGKARTELVYGSSGEIYFVHSDVTLNALRITSQELESFTKQIERTDAPAAKVEAARGIDKRKVMAAFQDIKWDYDKWGKNLASPSDKLKACRVSRGNKTASALWNPADIALYLLDEGEKLKTLDAVFISLNDWAGEWKEKTALERD